MMLLNTTGGFEDASSALLSTLKSFQEFIYKERV